jgi:hypothetical protein
LATQRLESAEDATAHYFGPLSHLDWLALGQRLRKKKELPPEGEKFTVWATLVQVRKMIAHGRKEQALELLKRCPKNFFTLYQGYLLALASFPPIVWKILQPAVKLARWTMARGFFLRLPRQAPGSNGHGAGEDPLGTPR